MLGTTVTILSTEVIDQFHNWCLGRGLSTNTAKSYRSDLKEFLKAIGETSIEMEEYEELAMSWLNLTRNLVAPKTTGRRLTSLRAFARWAGIPNALADYNAPTPGKAIPHPIPEGLDGVRRMIEKAKNVQQQALVGLCGFAGLRVHEALSCRTDWFNLHDNILTIRGKGDKTRITPFSTHAWSAVASAYVMALDAPDRRLISYKDRFARKIITNLGVRAGLSRPVSSHDLRATFATAVYDKTRDLRTTQELLGHSNSTTTEIYTAVSLNKMRSAIDF